MRGVVGDTERTGHPDVAIPPSPEERGSVGGAGFNWRSERFGACRSLLFDDVDFAVEGVAEGVVVFGVGNVEQ